MDRIKLGLPKGSLNDPERTDTYEVMTKAGYDVRGYYPKNESGSELEIVNDPEIDPYLIRPQSGPIELGRGLLDIAIIGGDWVKEEDISNGDSKIIKVGDFDYGYGGVRIVFAVGKDSPYSSLDDIFIAQNDNGKPILCFTEYINIARKAIMDNPIYKGLFGEASPLVQIRGLVEGENDRVQIINSDGATEEYIKKGSDFIVENTSTGKSMIRAGLREIGEITNSVAGLYAGPTCTGWKNEKAKLIYKQINGAVVGKEKFDVKFNAPNESVDKVVDYMISEGLCSDEPTVSNPGRTKTAINVIVDKDKYPDILGKMQTLFGITKIGKSRIDQFIE